MSSTPRLIGTLIVVVLKAKNLPNRRHIGKQDPYCTIKLNNETKRTKAVKRGGQHPEWDEEVRFELFEDMEDELARTARKRHGDDHDGHSTPPPPPKDQPKDRKVKGGKTMRLLCYADDPREPELIGETAVDLAEVLSKGETDEWFTLMHKDKYCGEVYLELTFWSNDKPPEKKPASRPSNLHPQYGGPGSFTPSGSDGGKGSTGSSPAGGNRLNLHDKHGSTPTSSIPPTSSLANLSLYIPPYDRDPVSHAKKYDPSTEFGDSSRRRDSYPPLNNRPVSAYGHMSPPGNFNPMNPNPFETVTVADPYATPTHSTYYQNQQSQFTGSMYQPNPPPVASGFVPPQPSMTPHPSGFQPLYSSFTAPRPSATPMPSYIPPPSSMGFHNYQPNPVGFVSPTPLPQAPPPQAVHPPFQHHPNSYPSVNQPMQNPGLNMSFSPPQPSISAPPTPFGQVPYQPSQMQPGQRPLPEQPLQNPSTITFPNPAPFVPNQTQVNQPIQNAPPKQVNQAPTAPTGFIPPPPPPPIAAQARSNSLPPAPANLPSSGSGTSVSSNGSLPIPPQSVSQQSTGSTASSNSGRSGLPLPPLPNPPSQMQSGLTRTTSALPGPPPPLQNGSGQAPTHQHQGSYSAAGGGFNMQPQYNNQNLPQPPTQYGAQPTAGWQPQSQIYAPGGVAPAPQFGQAPQPAPVPHMAAYPPQMQTQWRG